MRCTDPDASFVLKLYPDAFHWKTAKEVYIYGLLGRVESLPTPSILRSDDSRDVLPQSYVLMSKLPGQPLSEVAWVLDNEQLRDVCEEMGRLMARIHQHTFDAFGYLTTHVLNPHATNLAYMRFQFQRKLAQFDSHGGDSSLRRTVAAYVEAHEQVLGEAPTPVSMPR